MIWFPSSSFLANQSDNLANGMFFEMSVAQHWCYGTARRAPCNKQECACSDLIDRFQGARVFCFRDLKRFNFAIIFSRRRKEWRKTNSFSSLLHFLGGWIWWSKLRIHIGYGICKVFLGLGSLDLWKKRKGIHIRKYHDSLIIQLSHVDVYIRHLP